MKILYFGTYDQNYSRNRIIIDGLRAVGVEVIECHSPFWRGTDDKVAAASNGWHWISMGLRALKAYLILLKAYWPLRQDYDVMMLGYTGQLDVFPARGLTWLARRPLVLDVFISLYLTAFERGLKAHRLLRWLEYVAYRLPDRLVVEADEYREWMVETFRLNPAAFVSIPLGADDRRFTLAHRRTPDKLFRVLYYGKYIPLHGVEYIIQAAHLLRGYPDIVFELVGHGPMRSVAEALAGELGLEQVIFTDWIDPVDLPEYAGRADVLLGVFSNSDQSTRIIPNKVYEALALGCPLITGDSPTARSRLTHGTHAYLIERCNPSALAQAILDLRAEPALRLRLAENGRRLFDESYCLVAIGRKLSEDLQQFTLSRAKKSSLA